MKYKNKLLILFALIAIIIAYNYRYIWFQNSNATYLIENNQSSRVFPHRVNTVGKLKDIWSDGFRSFEVDAYFGNNNTNYFQVGHNEGVMGGSLEELLKSVDYTRIQRVWLDFKNLNEQNYQDAMLRLEYLDGKFNIKKKFIVESGTTSGFFRELKKEGWHISYYLPTGAISKLLEEKDSKGLKELASKIASQIKVQNLSAVSFDSRLYPFVKEYLECLISDDIVYHTWWGPKIYRYNFRDRLQKNRLFLDKRVKTILVRYKSRHHL